MRTELDNNDRDFLQQLNELGPGTVQDLCTAIGVTATAVRQRLQRLQASELIERRQVRAGRGRPHFEYSVTESGRRILGENYGDLALILWKEVQRIDESEVREKLLERVRDALVDQYRRGVNPELSLGERISQLSNALSERGFDVVKSESDELPILKENCCPYLELAEQDTGICDLEQEVFERVLQTPLARTTRCLDGHSCCEFVAAGENSRRD